MLALKLRRLLMVLALATVPFLMNSTCSVSIPYDGYWYYDGYGYNDDVYIDVWIDDDFWDDWDDDWDDCCYDDYYFDWFFDWW